MQKRWMSNEGSALPIVLTIMVIVVIFSVTALTIGSASMKQAENQELRVQAYYMARSGAHAVASLILNKAETLSETDMNTFVSNLNGKTSDPFSLDGTGEIRVTVTKDDSKGLLLVSSEAKVGGISRTVAVNINVEKEGSVSTAGDKVLFAMSGLNINNQTTIDGPIALSEGSLPNLNGITSISGTVYLPPGMDASMIPEHVRAKFHGTPQTAPLTEKLVFPTVKYPAYPATPSPSYTVSYGNKDYVYISGDEDINIVTKEFWLYSDLTVERAPGKKGVLNLYVTEKCTLDASIIADPKHVNIYFGGDPLILNGKYKLSATIYLDKANLIIDNNFKFTGYLYTGGTSIAIGNNPVFLDTLIYAPKANVNMNNNVTFTGSIVAGSLSIDKGEFKFKQMEFPFELESGSAPGTTLGKTTYTLGQWQ